MEFQSALVVAVVVASVLLVDRLGGSDELMRRLFQVALGVVLAATVVSATTAFIQPPGEPSSFFSDEDTGDPEKLMDRLSVAHTIQFAAGTAILLLALARRVLMPTLALGGVLGGVLLLLASAPAGAMGEYVSYVIAVGRGGASQQVDVFNFVVLLAASIGLLAFGSAQFERAASNFASAADDEGDTEY